MNFSEYFKENYNFDLNDDKINQAIDKIRYYIKYNKNIYLAGCGGSGYTASHFAQDLIKVLQADARSLSESVGLLSAISNDLSFDQTFEFQLRRLKPGLLIVFSYSGNSNNIIKAVNYGINNNFEIIGFSGLEGGIIKYMIKDIINIRTMHNIINTKNI